MYIFLLLLFVVVYVWGVWLVNYHLFILYPAFAIFLIKVIRLKKHPEEPVLKPPHLHYSIFTLVPYPWRIDGSKQGWMKMFFLDPIYYLGNK